MQQLKHVSTNNNKDEDNSRKKKKKKKKKIIRIILHIKPYLKNLDNFTNIQQNDKELV